MTVFEILHRIDLPMTEHPSGATIISGSGDEKAIVWRQPRSETIHFQFTWRGDIYREASGEPAWAIAEVLKWSWRNGNTIFY